MKRDTVIAANEAISKIQEEDSSDDDMVMRLDNFELQIEQSNERLARIEELLQR